MKNQKGISLIALIITIIVIIILAAIVITMSLSTPEQAGFAKYCNAMGSLQEQVTVLYGEVYTKHTIKGEVRTRAQIFREIATGNDVTSVYDEKSTEIVENKYIKSLPEIYNSANTPLQYYVTQEGNVFNVPAYDYDGELYYSNMKHETGVIAGTETDNEAVAAEHFAS